MRLAILGVGLIGGSIGLAARERIDGVVVSGFDPAPGALDRALERGAIDRDCATVEEALDGAEVCFVCSPVGELAHVAAAALACESDAVVSDVGSTKRSVLDNLSIAGLEEERLARFVGGHPLAGAETSGIDNAAAGLFEGARWYLTPSDSTSGVHYERLYRMVTDLGARPTAIGAAIHDRVMATVSHLPHVLANVLVSQAAHALVEEGQPLPATGPSFRDATRVAGANPRLWRDIFLANWEAIDAELESYVAALERVRAELRQAESKVLGRWIEKARADRQRLLELELAAGPVSEVRVSVPNRPGIVAQLALAVGEAGVNIVDMALYPAPDMRSGAISLWVEGEGSDERVVELIGALGYRAQVIDTRAS